MPLRSYRSFAFALMLGVGFVGGAPASAVRAETPVDRNAVAATVEGRTITEGDIAVIAEDFAAELQRVPEKDRRRVLLDLLVDMHVMAAAAESEGLAESDTYKTRMAFYKSQALRDAYYIAKIEKAITEPVIRAAYDKSVAEFKGEEEVHARHILVKTEDEAKAVIADLDGGADFAELAKAKSVGPSASSGGDLGFFAQGRMVPEFAAAAFALADGSYSKEPVKTQFGWHVIKVEERRTQQPPAYAAVRERIADGLKRERLSQTLEELKKSAKINITGADAAKTE